MTDVELATQVEHLILAIAAVIAAMCRRRDR
jgi:hypothetical protein